MNKTKPYEISKYVVLEAFERVKANKGVVGIDDESLEEFEADWKNKGCTPYTKFERIRYLL